MSAQISAGSIVETRCTRCRKIMNHTVVAMVGELIVRVECNTCHGVHNYHAIKVAKVPAVAKTTTRKAATPRVAKATAADIEAAEWQTLQQNMNPEKAIAYDMSGTYRLNNLLTHPTFGLGVVQLVQQNKIDVLFQDGKKRLRCG